VSQTGMPVTRSASVTARGTVINLQILPEHRQQPAAVSQVRALVDHGLEGDAHGKKKAGSRRQILILDKSTLQELGLRPGDLREQITSTFPFWRLSPQGHFFRSGRSLASSRGPASRAPTSARS